MPDELDALLDDLRAAAADVRTPAPGIELATLFLEGTSPVAAPRRARRWTVGVAVAGAVASVGFGGLGVAGALPAPVQARVADVAEQVGIDLPDGRDEKRDPVVPTTTSTTTSTTAPTVLRSTTSTTVSPSADAPGRTGEAPGRSDDRPGRGDEDPGRSSTAPGRVGATPSASRGRSSTAPGHTDEVPAKKSEVRDVAELRRNPTVIRDVDAVDRTGSRPADDGGALR